MPTAWATWMFPFGSRRGFFQVGTSSWVFTDTEVINEKGKLPWICPQELVLPKQGVLLLLGEEMWNMPLQTVQVSTSLCFAASPSWNCSGTSVSFLWEVGRHFMEDEIIGSVFWFCSGSVFQTFIWGSGEGWCSKSWRKSPRFKVSASCWLLETNARRGRWKKIRLQNTWVMFTGTLTVRLVSCWELSPGVLGHAGQVHPMQRQLLLAEIPNPQ